jgi:hypothetical protein
MRINLSAADGVVHCRTVDNRGGFLESQSCDNLDHALVVPAGDIHEDSHYRMN